jgi:Ni/Co efflux regulator RcnB
MLHPLDLVASRECMQGREKEWEREREHKREREWERERAHERGHKVKPELHLHLFVALQINFQVS